MLPSFIPKRVLSLLASALFLILTAIGLRHEILTSRATLPPPPVGARSPRPASDSGAQSSGPAPSLPSLAEARSRCAATPLGSHHPVQLLGTLVLTDPRGSVALLQEKGAPAVAVRRDHAFGNDAYAVLEIARKELCFETLASGEVERIAVDESSPYLAPTPQLDGLRRDIRKSGENHYRVKRRALGEAMKHLPALLGTALATGAVDGATGRFRGFRMQFITPDSPFLALGLLPGDLMTGANDLAFDSAAKGLMAYQLLQSQSHIALHVERDGQPVTVTFDLEP